MPHPFDKLRELHTRGCNRQSLCYKKIKLGQTPKTHSVMVLMAAFLRIEEKAA
ncbi:MAG: hypothetical protein ACI85U_002124 [Candidatus Promineifilaceae bacterium]|jgi:hypothetical protein